MTALPTQIAILRAQIEVEEAEAESHVRWSRRHRAHRACAEALRAELERLERLRPVVCDLTGGGDGR